MRRRVTLTAPRANSVSSATLASSQPHHVPGLRTRPSTSPTAIGPTTRTCSRTRSTMPGCRCVKWLAHGPSASSCHPPAPQRQVLGRHVGGDVGPVLEQLAGGDGVGDQRARVGAEAGEQRQLVAAHEHVDGVDLDEADVVEDAPEVLAGDPAGRPRARRDPGRRWRCGGPRRQRGVGSRPACRRVWPAIVDRSRPQHRCHTVG